MFSTISLFGHRNHSAQPGQTLEEISPSPAARDCFSDQAPGEAIGCVHWTSLDYRDAREGLIPRPNRFCAPEGLGGWVAFFIILIIGALQLLYTAATLIITLTVFLVSILSGLARLIH